MNDKELLPKLYSLDGQEFEVQMSGHLKATGEIKVVEGFCPKGDMKDFTFQRFDTDTHRVVCFLIPLSPLTENQTIDSCGRVINKEDYDKVKDEEDYKKLFNKIFSSIL